MAYALVGTAPAVTAGAAGATVTPAWGTSQNRTAGNLLVLWVAGVGGGIATAGGLTSTPPAGWTQAAAPAGSLSAAVLICFKIAAGADAAPSVVPAASNISLTARLCEFSGNANPLTAPDANNSADAASAGTGSPIVAKGGNADPATGDLVLFAYAFSYTANATKTFTPTLNNGMAATGALTNSGTTTNNHYWIGWGITTGNSAADQLSMVYTTTNISEACGGMASFPAAGATATVPPRRPLVVGQAVQRAATRCWARRPSRIFVPGLWTPDLA